jgi:hypothetical protein
MQVQHALHETVKTDQQHASQGQPNKTMWDIPLQVGKGKGVAARTSADGGLSLWPGKQDASGLTRAHAYVTAQ